MQGQGNIFMSTLNEILTKKDYSSKDYSKKRNIDVNDDPLNSGKPLWIKVVFVLFIVMAAMGDQKALNSMFGALPKAISIGAIALAFFFGIYQSDYKSLKKILAPAIMYISLLCLIMLYSLIIWILGFTELSSITRGASKMLFQLIAILVAVSGVYLFGKESIKLFLISFCICNGIIMLIELPRFGILASVSSLFHTIITFGDAKGYARALEIHDLTFIMGQFIVYYLLFAPKDNKAQQKERKYSIIAAVFFFLVGMKRIAFLAVGISLVIGLVIKNRRSLKKIIIGSGFLMVIFFFLFIYTVRTGHFMVLLDKMNIDTMGRSSAWAMAAKHYEFSPTFLGYGFESVDAIVKGWVEQGLTNRALPLHNDYLKVFIELGFYGFTVWILAQYVIYPMLWCKFYDVNTACVYICILAYMSVTFMTDNTAFSYWSTMALRLLPMAYASGVKKIEPALKWAPPTGKEAEYRIQELYEKN